MSRRFDPVCLVVTYLLLLTQSPVDAEVYVEPSGCLGDNWLVVLDGVTVISAASESKRYVLGEKKPLGRNRVPLPPV